MITLKEAHDRAVNNFDHLPPNLREIHRSHEKYKSSPPGYMMCERCWERPTDLNEYGRMMWICKVCSDNKHKPMPRRPNKAVGTRTKRRRRRR